MKTIARGKYKILKRDGKIHFEIDIYGLEYKQFAMPCDCKKRR